MDSHTWWWLSRAGGIIAWVVVAATVVWGLLASTKMIRRRGVPAWILDMHRYLGTLTVVFVIIHVATIWLDPFLKFGAKELFVPFAASWRPHAVAWGVFSTYLLLAILITSWTMRKLPRKLWHRVHRLSVPMLVMATVHGLLAGTDRSNRVVQWSAFLIGVGILFLVTARLLTPSRSHARAATPIREPGVTREKIAV